MKIHITTENLRKIMYQSFPVKSINGEKIKDEKIMTKEN